MGLFTTVASDLEAARKAKAAAEAAVATLTAQRVAALDQDGADPIAEVAKIDNQLAAHQAKVTIYDSRIAALLGKQRQQARRAREEDKQRWLAEIKKRYDRVIAEAEKLDRVLKADPAELVAAERAVFALPSDDFWPVDKYALPMLASVKLELRPQLQEIIKRASSDFSFAAEARRLRDLLLTFLAEEPLHENETEEAA